LKKSRQKTSGGRSAHVREQQKSRVGKREMTRPRKTGQRPERFRYCAFAFACTGWYGVCLSTRICVFTRATTRGKFSRTTTPRLTRVRCRGRVYFSLRNLRATNKRPPRNQPLYPSVCNIVSDENDARADANVQIVIIIVAVTHLKMIASSPLLNGWGYGEEYVYSRS